MEWVGGLFQSKRASYLDGEIVDSTGRGDRREPVPCAGLDGTTISVRDIVSVLFCSPLFGAFTSFPSLCPSPILGYEFVAFQSDLCRLCHLDIVIVVLFDDSLMIMIFRRIILILIPFFPFSLPILPVPKKKILSNNSALHFCFLIGGRSLF